jgi:uncharacterized protein (TIGR02594 family)
VLNTARDTDPAWLKVAFGEIGVHEVLGDGSNPEVEKYFAATRIGKSDDSTPWCKAFTSYCFRESGIPCDRAANARAALNWGVDTAPRRGALCVLWRGDPKGWQGHVGFYIKSTLEPDRTGRPTHYVYLLGGNQRGPGDPAGQDSVCISRHLASKVLGYRWPKEIASSKAVAAATLGSVSALATEVVANEQLKAAVEFSDTLRTVFQVLTFVALAYLAFDRISKITRTAT